MHISIAVNDQKLAPNSTIFSLLPFYEITLCFIIIQMTFSNTLQINYSTSSSSITFLFSSLPFCHNERIIHSWILLQQQYVWFESIYLHTDKIYFFGFIDNVFTLSFWEGLLLTFPLLYFYQDCFWLSCKYLCTHLCSLHKILMSKFPSSTPLSLPSISLISGVQSRLFNKYSQFSFYPSCNVNRIGVITKLEESTYEVDLLTKAEICGGELG